MRLRHGVASKRSLKPRAAPSEAARVEHDAARRAEGLRRQVLLEGSPDGAVVAVRPADHTPHAAVLAALLLRLGLVHVRDLLTHVEGRARAVLHTLDLHDVLVLVLGRSAAPLEAGDDALHVKPHRLLPRLLFSCLQHRKPTALTSL